MQQITSQILDNLQFDSNGLLPCIAQDFESKKVLMLAYMSKESLRLTLQTKIAHYFSRSKRRIWQKGEQSGNTQEVIEMWLDCDLDSILLQVKQNGVPCHTGNDTCFFKKIDLDSELLSEIKNEVEKSINTYGALDTLYHILLDRKNASSKESYTASLFEKGENAIAKKIIEEAGEFCFAFKDNDEEQVIYEGADLMYHFFVALVFAKISPDRIYAELARRMGTSGIDEKKNRAK